MSGIKWVSVIKHTTYTNQNCYFRFIEKNEILRAETHLIYVLHTVIIFTSFVKRVCGAFANYETQTD